MDILRRDIYSIIMQYLCYSLFTSASLFRKCIRSIYFLSSCFPTLLFSRSLSLKKKIIKEEERERLNEKEKRRKRERGKEILDIWGKGRPM